MSDLSKVKIGEVYYNLKDAKAREDLATEIGKLKTAAYRDVAAAISDGEGKIADAATVKAYVDAQVGSIKTFDVVICEAVAEKIPDGAEYKDGATVITGTMAAGADTMKKLYMVKNDKAGAGAYVEWISIDKGESASPRYSWEAIGTTAVELADYVKRVTEIAGVQIGDGISTSALQEALGLGELAYKDEASAEYTPAGSIDELNVTAAGTITLNEFTQTSTAATLTRMDYTPAGNVTGTVVPTGSVSVTIKDAATGTDITDLTYDNYTPVGSVSITADNAGVFQVAGTNSKSDVTITPSTTVVVSALKAGSTDAASIDTTKFNAGSVATWTGATFTAPTFVEGAFTAATITYNESDEFVKEGLKAEVSTTTVTSDPDYECLIFSQVTNKGRASVITAFNGGSKAEDTWNAGNVNFGEFNGGSTPSIGDGFFSAEKLPVVDDSKNVNAWVGYTAAEAAAQTFTGNKYNPTFSGTAEAVKLKGAKYLKQEINGATFIGNAAGDAITAEFAGTTVTNALVTGVNYDKATANGATFNGTEKKVTPVFHGTAATITVE